MPRRSGDIGAPAVATGRSMDLTEADRFCMEIDSDILDVHLSVSIIKMEANLIRMETNSDNSSFYFSSSLHPYMLCKRS